MPKRPPSLFFSRHYPYYIVTPDYRQNSAGIRATHSLCHVLNEQGYEAYITAEKTNPFLRTPVLDDTVRERHRQAGRPGIAVYPEIVRGNPLGQDVIVRWLLNKPGHLGGDERPAPTDIVFHWDAWVLTPDITSHRLALPIIDERIFNNDANPHHQARSGFCYYAHKYLAFGGKIDSWLSQNGISLCHDIPRPPEEIADILRRSTVLYCYEPSAIVLEAFACGCPVVYVATPYLDQFEWSAAERAMMTVEDRLPDTPAPSYDATEYFKSWAGRQQKEIWKEVSNFVRITQNAARRNTKRHTSLAATAAPESGYWQWLAAREAGIADADQSLENTGSESSPSVHLILRLEEGGIATLPDTLDSLNRQRYSRWFLDIVTPLPAPEGVDAVGCMGWHQVAEEQVKLAIDSLVEHRKLDCVVELPVGTVLDPLCLWRLARETALQPEISAFFVDDDVHDASGARQHPRFKPGVNREWLQRTDLAGPLFIRREAWIDCGGATMRSGSPWFDQLLRLADRLGWKSLAHVPDVLISYPETFPTDIKSCLLSLVENLQARGISGGIVPATGRTWNIRYPLPTAPTVTVAILSQGQVDLLARCLECVVERTRYPDYEIVISVTDRGLDPEIENWLASARQRNDIRIRTVGTIASGSHAARCNAAVEAATGEFVLLLREETIVIQANWLDELVRTCHQTDIAAAGPRLMTPGDKRIHDAGQVLGLNGLIDAPYRGVADFEEDGYLDFLKVGRDSTALPAACLLVRKTAYLAAGGMDEANLGDDRLATADLCQKLLTTGARLIYQPLATLLYRGSSELDVGEDDERHAARRQAEHTFAARWLKRGTRDPYWNANLSLIDTTPTPETDYQAQWQFLPTEAPRLLARTLPNAQGIYRVTAPLRALHRAGLASGCIWEQGRTREPSVAELCRLAPDAVIVQHYLMDQYLAALQRWRSSAARPFVVYSLDDLITGLDENNPARRNIPANSRSRFRYALERCDRLVVSTEYLAETYRRFCPDIRVVPNRLEQETWLPLQSRKRTTPKPRIGWAGGDTHQADLLLLKEVIEETRNEADWIFFGMCPEPLRPLLAEYHELRPLAEYPAHLASLNLDLAVAPLTDTPFNRGKSNLRLLEYGALAIPVVCSDIDPYQGSPACRVGNEAAPWIEAIRARLHDADAREQEGRALREWVYRGYLLENHLEEWLTAHLPDSGTQ